MAQDRHLVRFMTMTLATGSKSHAQVRCLPPSSLPLAGAAEDWLTADSRAALGQSLSLRGRSPKAETARFRLQSRQRADDAAPESAEKRPASSPVTLPCKAASLTDRMPVRRAYSRVARAPTAAPNAAPPTALARVRTSFRCCPEATLRTSWRTSGHSVTAPGGVTNTEFDGCDRVWTSLEDGRVISGPAVVDSDA